MQDKRGLFCIFRDKKNELIVNILLKHKKEQPKIAKV